jgi:hypothetical protein
MANENEFPTTEMIQTLRNLSKVEIDVVPSTGVLLYGIDGAEIRAEPSKLIPNQPIIHRVYLRYGQYKVGWIIDEDVKKCLICNLKFGLLQRKHHCRNCGSVICSSCSTHRAVIRQLKNETTSLFSRPESRVCDLCAAKHRPNEIWDAKPPVPTPASSPSPSPAPAPSPADETISVPSSPLTDPSTAAGLLSTPQEQPTNPSQYQYSDPVPLNLFPIMNQEEDNEDEGRRAETSITLRQQEEKEEQERASGLVEGTILPTPSQGEAADFSRSLHAFSVDDNEEDEAESDGEEDREEKESHATEQQLPSDSPSHPAPVAARRASWFEQKLGINLHRTFTGDEKGDESDLLAEKRKEEEGEEEGEGGIDSDSEGEDAENASSASGESVNSSRLSSRLSRSSRSVQSRSIRMNRTSDSYDEDSLQSISTDQIPSPMQSPSSSSSMASPGGFSPVPHGMSPHEPITISQLKLHSEQQRLIQLDQERRAAKLKQQQEEAERARELTPTLTLTPIKSKSGPVSGDDSLSVSSPPVSSASSSPASQTVSSSSPSPAKRRSSLMWFFGSRETAAETTTANKPSPIMRRGSDPGGNLPSRNSLSRDSTSGGGGEAARNSQEGETPAPLLATSKSLPFSS